MNLVFIYGPPGVGKLTVAKEVARLTGYKLFHNHQSIDAVRPVFTFGDASFDHLVRQIRLLVLEEAARQDVNVIFTFVYAHEVDDPIVASLCEVVERHGAIPQFVQLTCARDVLDERVQSADRAAMSKLTSIERVREYHQRYELFTPIPGRDSFKLDNTNVSPEDAARRIVEHYGLR